MDKLTDAELVAAIYPSPKTWAEVISQLDRLSGLIKQKSLDIREATAGRENELLDKE